MVDLCAKKYILHKTSINVFPVFLCPMLLKKCAHGGQKVNHTSYRLTLISLKKVIQSLRVSPKNSFDWKCMKIGTVIVL